MKKALIIGSSGQVGSALVAQFMPQERICCSSKSDEYFLDLEKPETIENTFKTVSERHGGCEIDVYLCSAFTNVDQCEREPAKSELMNVTGPTLIAQKCRDYNYKILFYSTEYVFGDADYTGGPLGPYSETAVANPCGVYGAHKLLAENNILKLVPEALIVRTTMVYSFDPRGSNFAMQVYRTLTSPQEPPTPIKVAVDQISTPTYAPWLAQASKQLMHQRETGIFNLVGSDLLSREEFIFRLAELFKVPRETANKRFIFLKTSAINQVTRRPLQAGLTMDKAKQRGIKLQSMEESFQEMQKQRTKA